MYARHPHTIKLAYILTDGINDPPPYYRGSVLSFEDILKQYGEYKKENTFVYVLTFGIEPGPVLKKLSHRTGAKVLKTSRTVPPPIWPVLRLRAPSDSFDFFVKKELSFTFPVKVEYMPPSISMAKFKVTAAEIPPFFTIGDTVLIAKKSGEKLGIHISAQNLPVGNYKINLHFSGISNRVRIIPENMNIKVTIKPLNFWRKNYKYLFAGFILLIIIGILSIIIIKSNNPVFSEKVYLISPDTGAQFRLKDYQRGLKRRVKPVDLSPEFKGAKFVIAATAGGGIRIKGKNVKINGNTFKGWHNLYDNDELEFKSSAGTKKLISKIK